MFILGSLIVFNLYKRSEPNKAILVNNCFKPGAGILGFKEAEEYFMMIECFSSCGNLNTLNHFPLNNDITFKQLFWLDLNKKDMKKKNEQNFVSSRKITKLRRRRETKQQKIFVRTN